MVGGKILIDQVSAEQVGRLDHQDAHGIVPFLFGQQTVRQILHACRGPEFLMRLQPAELFKQLLGLRVQLDVSFFFHHAILLY